MLPRNDPDRINIAFDDHRLVAKPDCRFRSRRPIIWGWAGWWTAMLIWEVGPTLETRC